MDTQDGQFDEFEPEIDAVGGMPCTRAVKATFEGQFGSSAADEGNRVVARWSDMVRRVMKKNDRSSLVEADGVWTMVPSRRDAFIFTVTGRDTDPTIYSTEWKVGPDAPGTVFAHVVGFWIGGADQRP
jgi:hypothetical protein